MPKTQRTTQGGAPTGAPNPIRWVLPFWVAVRVAGGYQITCPRKACGRRALVDKAWPKDGYGTRPCTYCFKTAVIPEELR